MIVDLMRSDLGRVSAPGSVTCRAWQRRSRILASGTWCLRSAASSPLARSDADLVAATFPPGSVTGAPKVRAMEVIGQLEAAPREVYTGAIGYRSPVAGMELNVAIRTFEFAAGRVWLGGRRRHRGRLRPGRRVCGMPVEGSAADRGWWLRGLLAASRAPAPKLCGSGAETAPGVGIVHHRCG